MRQKVYCAIKKFSAKSRAKTSLLENRMLIELCSINVNNMLIFANFGTKI